MCVINQWSFLLLICNWGGRLDFKASPGCVIRSDISQMYPSGRDMAKHGTTSSRLAFGQIDPPVQTSHGLVWYYFGQADLWSDPPRIRPWVRLTFDQSSGQGLLWSDVCTRQRHLVAKCVTTLVSLTSGQMPPKTCGGQV